MRLQNGFKILNLENRVAQDENDMSVINNEIDSSKINSIIDEERKKSIKWLKDSLV